MSTSVPQASAEARSPVDRFLGLFSDVRAGEGVRALLMLVNVFLILVSYYILKTVREPLILAASVPEVLQGLGIHDTAEVKTYASAGQALLLMGYIPLYGWVASKVERSRLVLGVTLFFFANLVAFAWAVAANVEHIGVYFYIWVGIFSLSIIAQFWSYANDTYSKEAGDRLFPIIAIGSTLGSPVGAWITASMFEAGVATPSIMYLAALLLFLTAGLFLLIDRSAARRKQDAASAAPIGGKSGFALVFASPYIRLIALLLVLLNVVNTTGEFILSHMVTAHADTLAAAAGSFDKKAYIGAFYGNYFLWVNVAALVLQGFVASRLVKLFGLAGVLFALPLIAVGAYGFIALGATISIVRWAKTAENSADYSVMNTAKQLMWLPTSREEKYKAKQAVDAFFYRIGDLTAAAVVFVGTAWLGLGPRGFSVVNLLFIAVWLLLGLQIVRENRRLSAA
jgi:ATP:ADP antiporter, AAA family